MQTVAAILGAHNNQIRQLAEQNQELARRQVFINNLQSNQHLTQMQQHHQQVLLREKFSSRTSASPYGSNLTTENFEQTKGYGKSSSAGKGGSDGQKGKTSVGGKGKGHGKNKVHGGKGKNVGKAGKQVKGSKGKGHSKSKGKGGGDGTANKGKGKGKGQGFWVRVFSKRRCGRGRGTWEWHVLETPEVRIYLMDLSCGQSCFVLDLTTYLSAEPATHRYADRPTDRPSYRRTCILAFDSTPSCFRYVYSLRVPNVH